MSPHFEQPAGLYLIRGAELYIVYQMIQMCRWILFSCDGELCPEVHQLGPSCITATGLPPDPVSSQIPASIFY